jgi:PEP-CTERM motif
MTSINFRDVFAIVGLLGVATAAQANLNYTFDTNSQGFGLVGDGLLEHVTEAANGFLKITDTNGSTDVFLNVPIGSAPVDWTAYLGGTLSFDGIMLNAIAPSWPDFGTIRFTSMTDQVIFADLALPTDPTNTWKSYSATLNASTFADQGGATLAGVLANLKSVTLSAEAGNGPVEVVGIDNFKVTMVPEPTTGLLMLAGLTGMVFVSRYRKKG